MVKEASTHAMHDEPGEPGRRYTGGVVRRFSEPDIPGVADLHCRVSGVQERSPQLLTAYRRYFSRVFLDELWDGDGISSLVHEDGRGAITGFLGAIPRWMTMGRTRLLAAVSSQAVVDGQSGSDRIGHELLRAFLQQRQDLSIADWAGDATRASWEALGGRVAPVHSMSWTQMAPKERPPRSPRHDGQPALAAEEMCSGTYVEQLPALTGRETLRPDDDERTLRWALERVSAQGEWAEPEGVLLRDPKGRPVGAYFHYLDRQGTDHVLQLVAVPSFVDQVTGHLFHRAFRQGAIAVEGRLSQHVALALSRHGAVFHQRGPWVLVHSKRPEVRATFDRGDAVLSPLEGALCLRFWGSPAVRPAESETLHERSRAPVNAPTWSQNHSGFMRA